MLKERKEEKYVYIGHRKERIEIDGDVKAVMKIIEEIIENEKTKWLKELLTDNKEGWKDYKIVIQFPIERSKYYQIKERFVNKIYQCCIYRGLVEYLLSVPLTCSSEKNKIVLIHIIAILLSGVKLFL